MFKNLTKKKLIIIISISVVILLSLIASIVFFIKWNNRIVSTITLDINPSIGINLDRKDKVKSVVALNSDANIIVSGDFNGKTLEDSLEIITDRVMRNGYAEEDHLVILVHAEGSVRSKDVEMLLVDTFRERNVNADVVTIDNVTVEDEEVARKYGITPSKASYINSLKKGNDISVEDFVDKSVRELKESKDIGFYCDKQNTLEGTRCIREISSEPASSGIVCPNGYYEYEDKCYEEVRSEESDKLVCREEFTLVGDKCTREMSFDAQPSKYTCPSGEARTMGDLGKALPEDGIYNDITCVDYSSATHPVSPCEANDGTEFTVIGGVCYWHRAPIIESGCPGKIQVGGACWDNATGIYICPGYRDGKRYSSRDEYCEHSIKYTDPIITEYTCPEHHVLEGTKCVLMEEEDAMHERYCPSGYTLVNNDRCINVNKTEEKVRGYVCNREEDRLEGNRCITYEEVDAKEYR